MTNSAPAFARLIAPVSVEDFLRDHWERALLYVGRKNADYYADQLTVAEIERYLQTQHIAPHFLGLIKDGEPCPNEDWTFIARSLSNQTFSHSVDVKKILKLFSGGATVIINSGETAIPSLTGLCRALESELNCSVQANIYITPPNSQGFAPHFDSHNVFILQIHGHKRWFLYDTPVESPVRTTSVEPYKYEECEPSQIIDLSPGDLLYVPRGLVHAARAEETASIHATVGTMVRHWADVLKMLVSKAEEEAAFRRPLPLGISCESEKAGFAAEFAEELKKLLEKSDLPAIHRRRFVEEQKTDVRGQFSDLLKIGQLNKDSVVRRRPYLDFQIERNDQWLTVRFGSEEISLPVFVENALGRFLQENPFAVREIENIPNDAGKLSLVKRFIQAGFLVIESV